MAQIARELLDKIWGNELFLIAVIIFGLHQGLKYWLHRSSFFYDNTKVSLGKSYCLMGGELSIVSISLLVGSLQSGKGVIYWSDNPGLYAAMVVLVIAVIGAVAIEFVFRGYPQTDRTGFVFGLKKFVFTSVSIFLGWSSLIIGIHCC